MGPTIQLFEGLRLLERQRYVVRKRLVFRTLFRSWRAAGQIVPSIASGVTIGNMLGAGISARTIACARTAP
jgi:hypothetical protein